MKNVLNQLLIVVLSCIVQQLHAQASGQAKLNDFNHFLYDRAEVLSSNFQGQHTSSKPLSRDRIRKGLLDYYGAKGKNKFTDFNQNWILAENNINDTTTQSKKPLLKHFYKSPAHFLELRKPKFYINANPILHLNGGLEQYSGTTGNSLNLQNRRGLELEGAIANRIYFYTNIIESQAALPAYIGARVSRDFAVPGAGFFKNYDSRLTPQPNDGFDYLLSEAYINFDVLKDIIGLQFGHGRNFIGDGHRSMLLSDYSTNYLYLKLTTKVWKFQYQNLFAELAQNYDLSIRAFDYLIPKKYMAAHYLTLNVTKNFSLGFYEAVVFARPNNSFELNYLNPVIFYRSVEQAIGSSDNILLATTWKWNFLKHFSFYGQFALDELSVGDIFNYGFGWWGNKFALQSGLKYYDMFGVSGLDLLMELNLARPYTYAFRDSTANYSHYNQPLAHPMGANFIEGIAKLTYRPIPRLMLQAQANYARYGQDDTDENWGGNIYKSYYTFEQHEGNKIGQGVETQLLFLQFAADYQIKHNLVAELRVIRRQETVQVADWSNNTTLLNLGLRWNIAATTQDW